MTHKDESVKSPNFFQDNNAIKKKNKDKVEKVFIKHIIVGIKKEDFYNQNFVFDIYVLMTKNLNRFH